jgi:hypothetical protein
MARTSRSQSRMKLQGRPEAPAAMRPRAVVQGLRLHVSGKELAVRLGERIRWHRHRGDVLIEQMQKLAEVERQAGDELARALTPYDSPRARIERQLREHQERASFLAFLRDHLSLEDVYRLDSADLRTTEILPEKPW